MNCGGVSSTTSMLHFMPGRVLVHLGFSVWNALALTELLATAPPLSPKHTTPTQLPTRPAFDLAAEQYNATTQQLLQTQQQLHDHQQQQEGGSSGRKKAQHKQQPPLPDCELSCCLGGGSLPMCNSPSFVFVCFAYVCTACAESMNGLWLNCVC